MRRLDRKGFGALGFAMLYIFLWIMWPLVFAHMFSIAGENAVAAGATGIEAFFWMNINLWFFFCLIIVGFIYLRFGGEGQ